MKNPSHSWIPGSNWRKPPSCTPCQSAGGTMVFSIAGAKPYFSQIILACASFSSLFIVNGMKNNDLLGLLSLLFLSIIIYPILLLVLSETMVYKSTIIECLKNGVIIYFRTLPITLSVAALVMLPSLIQFIPSYFIRILAFLGMVILALPFLMLIWFLYSCNLFDKYININLFPELVKKGLYKVDE